QIGAPEVFGRFRSGGGFERAAADELDGVGELGNGQQTVQRSLRRVIDVIEVGDTRTGNVQHLLDVVALIAQGLGEVVELVDRIDDRRVVLVQDPADVGEGLVQGAQGVVQMTRTVGEDLRHRGDVSGELHDLVVAG